MADKKVIDPFSRGIKGSNAFGSATLALGRLADPIIQTAILTTPLLTPVFQRFGIVRHPAVLPSVFSLSTESLSAIPIPRLLLIGLSATNAIQQAYWGLFVSQEPVTVKAGAGVSAVNIVIASFWSVLYLTKATSLAQAGEQVTQSMLVAVGLTVMGLAIEMWSEAQRRSFKLNPANRGKLYTGGLFSFARHINYTGFTLSRMGPAILASGWTAGAILGSLNLWDLGGRAAGILDQYCGNRYGEQWAAYKRKVPSKMIPGIY